MRWSKDSSARIGILLAFGLAAGSCSCGDGETVGQLAKFEAGLEVDLSGEADYLIDFGVVALGNIKIERVPIRNKGNRELLVSGPRLESPFSHDLPAGGLDVGVGASGSLLFAFEPLEENSEPLQFIATLMTNEQDDRTYTVRLVGQGRKASLDCDPALLDFGAVAKGSKKTLKTICTNSLPIELELGHQLLTGSYAQFFSATLPGSEDGPTRLPPNGEIAVEVSFRSRADGANEAVFEIFDSFNQELALVSLRAESVNSTLVVDPASCLDFSFVSLGESSTLSFQVEALGEQALEVIRLELPEKARSEFTLLTAAPIQLLPGEAAKEILIEFHPSSIGSHSSQLELQVEGPLMGTQLLTACVKGLGGGPAISCTPSVLDFGMTELGIPEKGTIVCTNAGAPVPGVTLDPLVVMRVRSTAPEFSPTLINTDGSLGPKRNGYQIGEVFQLEIVYAPTAERVDRGSMVIEFVGGSEGSHETKVSGQGGIPPCDFELNSPELRFGIVDKGKELTLSLGMKNRLRTSCWIEDLRLSPESDPAFFVEPIQSFKLLGGQSLQVEVTFAPKSYGALFLGAVEFEISNAHETKQKIPLRGTSAQPCLLIEPPLLDFGASVPGCKPKEAMVTVTNVCGVPATLDAVGLQERSGQDAFHLKAPPALPRVLPAYERETFTVLFSPTGEGSFSGTLAVSVHGSEPYLSGISGEGAPDPIRTDTFGPDAGPKVDILWVMDNSTSFDSYQDRVAANLEPFVEVANEGMVDYRIAVTTSGILSAGDCPGGALGGEDGRLFPIDGSHPRILTPTTPDLAEHWAHNVRVGTCHNQEQYLEAAFQALSEPLINERKSSKHAGLTSFNDGNAGFLRPDASLSLIIVADEPDQSVNHGRTLEQYISFFRGLKAPGKFKAHAIYGSGRFDPELNGCPALEGDRILSLVNQADGVWVNLCTPVNDGWASELKRMGEGAFSFTPRLLLKATPDDRDGDGIVTEEDIELRVNGVVLPTKSPAGQRWWTYDFASNIIDFSSLVTLEPSDQMDASYRAACGTP